MNEIDKIIELAEHPERFSEEQMTALLSDEENLKTYLTVSETMMAVEGNVVSNAAEERDFRGQTEKKPAQRLRITRRMRWAAAVLALFVFGGVYQWIDNAGEIESYVKTHDSPAVAPNPHTDMWGYRKKSAASTKPSVTPHGAKRNVGITKAKEISVRPGVRLNQRLNQNVSPAITPEIDRQIKLQLAKMDNEIAAQTAEACLAEYYAQQLANGEEMAVPTVSLTLGDDQIPQPNIMTLIMQ